MKNNFNVSFDGFTLWSTDDYFVVAEILDPVGDPVLQWYREENGFTFKFLSDKYNDDLENLKVIFKLLQILIKIIDNFMLDDDRVLQLGTVLSEHPALLALLKASGIKDLGEYSDEDLDNDDDEDYNEGDYDDLDDDTYFFGREDDNNENEEPES